MRIVVHGQQAFGKAVLEALIKRGEDVIAAYVAPEKEKDTQLQYALEILRGTKTVNTEAKKKAEAN